MPYHLRKAFFYAQALAKAYSNLFEITPGEEKVFLKFKEGIFLLSHLEEVWAVFGKGEKSPRHKVHNEAYDDKHFIASFSLNIDGKVEQMEIAPKLQNTLDFYASSLTARDCQTLSRLRRFFCVVAEVMEKYIYN